MMKRLICMLLSLALLCAAPFALAEDTAEAPEETTAEVSAEPAAEPSEETVEEAPAEEEARVLLATVNGEEIWSDDADVQYAYSYYTEMAQSYGMDPAEESVIPLLRQYSMEYALQTKLLFQKADELGLGATDADMEQLKSEISAGWAQIVDSFIEEGVITEESTEEEKAAARADAENTILETYGYDEEKYINDYIREAAYSLIIDRLKTYAVGDKTVTEEDVQQYFDDLVKEDREAYENEVSTYEFYTQYYGQSSYYTPEGYRGIIHILLPVDEELMNNWKNLSTQLEEQQSEAEAEPTEDGSEGAETAGTDEQPAEETTEETPEEPTEEPTATPEPVTQEMVDAAEQAILDSVQPTVDEINKKLEEGTSFADLIKEYGTDPGMQNEETLATGYLVHNDSILYDPAFKKAAMELEKIGDISKPIVGQYGVHILQYLRDVPGGAAELTPEMKEEFRSTLQDELESDALTALVEEWMASAVIEYTAEGESWKPEEAEAEEPAETEGEAGPAPDDGEAAETGSSPADEAAASDEGPASPAEESAPAEEAPASPSEDAE